MYTELHRHLDASLRPETIAELSQSFGTEPCFADAREVRERLWITEPVLSLDAALDRFALFPQLLRTADVLVRVAGEAVEDARTEGIDCVEFRYAPAFVSHVSRLPFELALGAIEHGLHRATAATGVRVGLIGIVGRRFGMDEAERVMDFIIAHRGSFVGVDLAGPEKGHPCRDYAALFRRADAAGLPVTVHAGEADGPRNVWEAIDLLGAVRIGHGVSAIKDKALIARLARDRIMIESCPTSNVMTGAVGGWNTHPLPVFLDAGVPVSISTDDPAVFGVTIADEFARCRTRMGIGEADLERLDHFARQHAFLGQTDRSQKDRVAG